MTTGATTTQRSVERRTESLGEACGETLVELGATDPGMVVLDAGRADSTHAALFSKQYPHRFFEVGGTEPSMVAIATGLALGGRTVFTSTFAVFGAGHAYHMIRECVCSHRANVKIVATHGGRWTGEDGGPRPMLEDIGLMRGLPRMTVIVPSDGPSTRAALRAVASFGGPAYVRLTRENLPRVTDGSFTIGHAAELRQGSDLAIVAVGALVAIALDIAGELHRVGVETRVIDLASVKPFDEKAILRAARDTGAILTMEDHTVTTGIGSMVASATSENYPVPVRRIGVPDVFGSSGETGEWPGQNGLTAERGLEEAWELLGLRGKVQ